MKMMESYPMNGGDGTYSYTKNSSFQRQCIRKAKSMIDEIINQNLEITASNSTFKIGDLGCSVGPNALICVENIIEAVKVKYHESTPEFQVFFNDHTFNDFNTLFRSLPPEKQYFAAGVVGSFHQRLFPENSIDLIHSSNALHWLSHVPKELLDTNSPCWNKGRIYYPSAPQAVTRAYSAQFAKDMDIFFKVRSKEVVEGGIMVLIFPTAGLSHSSVLCTMMLDALGPCLMDMAKAGSVSESLVDSFNLPLYIPTKKEMLEVVGRNGSFKIEKIELFDAKSDDVDVDNDMKTIRNEWVMCFRASLEGVLTTQFGNEIMDELFDRFSKKIEQLQVRPIGEMQMLFLALKRNSSHL
ncbi:loganic acid O-methyltransferase-like isoform X2 [Euphorbia lathyris]|uniref:loganic acid O-methyltransferase-like isoform X2 n=1 Tax=Euphorbia lathyris TaxID=212925 RepID=UPI003313B26F